MSIRTPVVKANANAVAELLIRAAAHLGNLTEEELAHVEHTTGLPSAIRTAFGCASKLSDTAQDSLKRNPPKGFDLT
ncbi:hypothetical protein [Acidovorax sp. sic0104]|uniref:hypothetical protein n=1 Tax=Acidovorax sp. sic0104 TaxID=2854784 RepID=UPI001C4576A5|nr:hypothetical protein [Acidovorax sp. sic0104]MBV7541935.1 hypothetical protein [Acidovorax sp. sic0104]